MIRVGPLDVVVMIIISQTIFNDNSLQGQLFAYDTCSMPRWIFQTFVTNFYWDKTSSGLKRF